MAIAKNAQQNDDEILTPKQLAEQLKVSESWVKDHALGRRKPPLPVIRLGSKRGLIRFRQSDIQKFLRDNQRGEVA